MDAAHIAEHEVFVMAQRHSGKPKTAPQKQESLGERIARLRRERGLSQGELGERIGVVQRVVSHYENDELRVPAETLLKIADVLKVSVYELHGRATSTRAPKNLRLWKVLEEIEALPPHQQRALLTTIGTFLKGAKTG